MCGYDDLLWDIGITYFLIIWLLDVRDMYIMGSVNVKL